jgi:hypothetical protein
VKQLPGSFGFFLPIAVGFEGEGEFAKGRKQSQK